MEENNTDIQTERNTSEHESVETTSTDRSVYEDVMASMREIEGGTDTQAKQENIPSTEVKQPPPTQIERPRSWAKEYWNDFDALPDNLKQVVLTREKERETQLSKKQQEFAEKSAPFLSLAQKHQDIFPNGISVEVLDGLIQMRKGLQTNPKETLTMIKQHLGIDENSELESDDYVVPPIIGQLEAKINSLQDYINNVKTKEVEEVHRRNFDEVTKFATAINENGELLYPHYKEVAGDMIPILAALKESRPNDPSIELLKDAYERATWSNSSVREKLIEAQIKNQLNKQSNTLESRQIKGSSLPSRNGSRSVSSNKKVDPNDLRALVAAVYDGEI